MPLNTFLVELTCRHCGRRIDPKDSPLITSLGDDSRSYRPGDLVPIDDFDLEESFLETFRPAGDELRLLMAWSCPTCRGSSCAQLVIRHGRLNRVEDQELSADWLLRAHRIDQFYGEDLHAQYVAGALHVAGSLKPAWVHQIARSLRGEPPVDFGADSQEAMRHGLERLRAIEWEPTLAEDAVERQLTLVRQHLDAVSTWLYIAKRSDLWPWFQPHALIRPGEDLLSDVVAQLNAEPWYAALPPHVPARWTAAEWLLWLALDAAGEIPWVLPDPMEPLIRVFEAGGYYHRSRKLRNELEFGSVTLRIPAALEEWPFHPVTSLRPSLYRPPAED